MTNQTPKDLNGTWSIVLHYVACYLSWILLAVVGFWLVFLLRTNLVEDVLFLRVNPWQLRAIDLSFMTTLGGGWLFVVIWAEGYLRAGIDADKLSFRIRRLFLIELISIAISFGIHFLSNTHIF